jgi:hypothetical protein
LHQGPIVPIGKADMMQMKFIRLAAIGGFNFEVVQVNNKQCGAYNVFIF